MFIITCTKFPICNQIFRTNPITNILLIRRMQIDLHNFFTEFQLNKRFIFFKAIFLHFFEHTFPHNRMYKYIKLIIMIQHNFERTNSNWLNNLFKFILKI
jgi:hypothetical protein